MGLILPDLDDKPFEQIAEEARLLIPSNAAEWTDHNVHDPGITFVELFAWLAEMEHYRLNQTARTSYERFFSLMGIAPSPAQAAEVTVSFEFSLLPGTTLLPSNTGIEAIGVESIPFQTIYDQYLTRTQLTRIVTNTGGRDIVQTTADSEEVGHYEAFGLYPAIGDFLLLEFDSRFTEPQVQLEITLFESDLPPRREALTTAAPGFEPSAKVRWEYLQDSPDPRLQWEPLDVIRDGTLSLSRSGELIFRRPRNPSANKHQIRVVLSAGRYEIPPRILSIRTNVIKARQVGTIVNESLKEGLGTADQVVRLKKYPLFLNPTIDDGPFQVGEVLDWKALIGRLNNLDNYPGPQKEALGFLLSRLSCDARDIIESNECLCRDLNDEETYKLACAFNALIETADFYTSGKFKDLKVPPDLLKIIREQGCQKASEVRRFNRFVLQTLLRDLVVSDRLEIQTSIPRALSDDEGLTWLNWDPVENFLKSGPNDPHYVFDPQAGIVRFGNGLNGRIPEPSELIRARFYRYSQAEKGNLPARRQWTIKRPLPQGTVLTKGENISAAAGGRQKETTDETRSRSRRVFRKERAILTARDYELLVLNTPGLRVAGVRVIANFSPKLSCLSLPGEVTILVLPHPPPRSAFPNTRAPEASEGFLNTIRNHLDTRRLVTTNIHVIGPQYVTVRVSCRVFLKKRVSQSEALDSIHQTLANFLDPVLGGPQKEIGWVFGRSVFPSELSQHLAKLRSVDYVTNVQLNDLGAGEALRLPYNGLPTSGTHTITTVPFEDRGRVAEVDNQGCHVIGPAHGPMKDCGLITEASNQGCSCG